MTSLTTAYQNLPNDLQLEIRSYLEDEIIKQERLIFMEKFFGTGLMKFHIRKCGIKKIKNIIDSFKVVRSMKLVDEYGMIYKQKRMCMPIIPYERSHQKFLVHLERFFADKYNIEKFVFTYGSYLSPKCSYGNTLIYLFNTIRQEHLAN